MNDDNIKNEADAGLPENSELKVCHRERQEYLDGWKRAKADLINYRKDESKRLEEIARFISGNFIGDLLAVLDSFELALSHDLPKDSAKGIFLIRSQLSDILRSRGLEEIEVSTGGAFDPAVHEAVGEIESTEAPGHIAEEVQKGYRLQGKVLRPSRVKLAKQLATQN